MGIGKKEDEKCKRNIYCGMVYSIYPNWLLLTLHFCEIHILNLKKSTIQ